MPVGETNPFISVGAQPEQAFRSEMSPDNSWQNLTKEQAESQTAAGGQYKDVFGVLQGRNIVFCVDCSGSMYEHLPIVIHQLYQVLTNRLTQDNVTKHVTQFNIISFSTHGVKWREEPATLNEETLQKAHSWLKNLETETSTNTLDALLQALSDCTVDTVYLVTDGLPDQRPALVVECVLRNNRGRPIITIMIGAGNNGNADLLLTDLASVTGGSFRPINLPLKLPDPDELAKLPEGAIVMLHGGVTERNIDTSYLQQESKDLRWKGDVPPAYPTVRAPPPPDKVVKFPISASGRLMINKEVLARHPSRGDYHRATITDQHSPTCFEVEYVKSKEKERCQLCHIFVLQDTLMHPVPQGSHVLAPLRRGGPYEPGNVVRGEDTLRGTNYDGTAGDLMVVLYSGITVMCRGGTAIWVPKEVYNRMVIELRIVPSTKSSMEAVEALKMSEHNPTSPTDLHEYIISKNNGPRDTDVCGDLPETKVSAIPGVSPVEVDYDICCDSTDQDTIRTTLSQVDMKEDVFQYTEGRKSPIVEEFTPSLPGYVSGMLAEEGHFDEMLGIPDHPRFNTNGEAEEDEEEKQNPWQHVGKASEGKKSPTSRPIRPSSSSVARGKSTYREDFHVPSKIDVSFDGTTAQTPNQTARPSTVHTSRPSANELKQKEKLRREAERDKKNDKVMLAKARVASQLKQRDVLKGKRGLQIAKDTKFREGPTGQALTRTEEKKKLKNVGSHQQETGGGLSPGGALSPGDSPISSRTVLTVQDDKSGKFSGYKLKTTLNSGTITHSIPPTFEEGSNERERLVVKAVSHAVQTDNKYNASRRTSARRLEIAG